MLVDIIGVTMGIVYIGAFLRFGVLLADGAIEDIRQFRSRHSRTKDSDS